MAAVSSHSRPKPPTASHATTRPHRTTRGAKASSVRPVGMLGMEFIQDIDELVDSGNGTTQTSDPITSRPQINGVVSADVSGCEG